ncbi:uncharacterized protein LOC143038783 [Oratosquilla oratoria]|uniref:uncharacterized protein LOC143038783 n=1 Tax=Oratosquilla oratoria TaxID=337810 RepID=UPI003F76FBA8
MASVFLFSVCSPGTLAPCHRGNSEDPHISDARRHDFGNPDVTCIHGYKAPGSRITHLPAILALLICLGLAQGSYAEEKSGQQAPQPGSGGPPQDPDFWLEFLPPFVSQVVKLRLDEQRGLITPEEAAAVSLDDIWNSITLPTDSPSEAWLKFLPSYTAKMLKTQMDEQKAMANGPMGSRFSYVPPQAARFM